MKKSLILCLLLLVPAFTFAQDYAKMARDLQPRFKDDEAIILQSSYTYEFSKGTKAPIKVALNKNTRLLSLRYNEVIHQTEWYDQNSQIEKFYASSSLKQKLDDGNKFCGLYTSEGLFYDDGKFCTHQLKLKELGEVWDVTSTKRIDDAKYLTTIYFQEQYPTNEKKTTFVIPQDVDIELREFYLSDFGITRTERTEGGKKIIEFIAKDLKPQKREDLERGSQYSNPHVLVILKSVVQNGKSVNVLSSPQDLYAWYNSLVRQLKPNQQAFKSKVNELIQGKQTDEEKIKAIYYWVQDNIRYIAFEDGIAGFKPSEAQDVFEKRYGDCKGMANLTKEMLKAAGYDARLTWIGTRRIMYDHSYPTLAANNHMICTLLLNGKKYFLDATEKYIPFGENAARIQDRSVMIEDGDKFIIDKVATSAKKADADQRVMTATINGENIEGKIQVNVTGEAKKNFLYAYHYTKSEKRNDYVSDFLSSGNKNVKTSDLKLPDLNERSGPLSLDCAVVFSGAVTSFNNEYYVDIDPSKSFKNWTIKDTRQSDIDFGERIYKKTSIELAIPAGFTVSHLPEKVDISDPEFSFSMQYTQVGSKIVYTKEISIPEGIIKKKSFPKWNEAIKKLQKGYENQLILKK